MLNGNGGNDRLYGGIGDDTVNGGNDNDLVSGGWGVDTVDGQAGDDLARGDGSADRLRDSGGGTDTISYATAVPPGYPQRSGYPTPPAGFPAEGGERGVYVDLGGGTGDNGEPRFGGGLDVEVDGADFENVIGSPFADYIVGNSGANKIYAGGGADVVLGGDGNDEIHGGADGTTSTARGAPTAPTARRADHCVAETQASCGAAAGVVTRDATKVSVGQVSGGPSGPAGVYLAGSNIADNISAGVRGGATGDGDLHRHLRLGDLRQRRRGGRRLRDPHLDPGRVHSGRAA